jgi:hypothetical protein
MGYIFISLVFLIEMLQRHYVRLFIEAMYQSRTDGYKNTDQIKYQPREEKKINGYIIDKTQIKIGSQYTWL